MKILRKLCTVLDLDTAYFIWLSALRPFDFLTPISLSRYVSSYWRGSLMAESRKACRALGVRLINFIILYLSVFMSHSLNQSAISFMSSFIVFFKLLDFDNDFCIIILQFDNFIYFGRSFMKTGNTALELNNEWPSWKLFLETESVKH